MSMWNFNPNLTISAGIALAKPRIPIAHCADWAEEHLEKSKEIVLPDEKNNRDQLTFLGETMKWSKVTGILEDSKVVAERFEKRQISASIMRKLSHIANLYNPNFIMKMIQEECVILPLLDYELAKEFPKKIFVRM